MAIDPGPVAVDQRTFYDRPDGSAWTSAISHDGGKSWFAVSAQPPPRPVWRLSVLPRPPAPGQYAAEVLVLPGDAAESGPVFELAALLMRHAGAFGVAGVRVVEDVQYQSIVTYAEPYPPYTQPPGQLS
jgi:hypothetical protein